MMLSDRFHLILQGLIQGVTEVFPISSSGHLIILSRIFGLNEVSVSQAAWLHMGSMLAIGVIYIVPLTQIYSGRMGWNVLRGFLVSIGITVLIGLAIRYFLGLGNDLLGDNVLVILFVNGVLIGFFGYKWGTPHRTRIRIEHLELRHYLLLGLAQGIATLPGISRLGMTLLVGLWAGLNWGDSLTLSFVAGMPVFLGAGLFESLNSQIAFATSTDHLISLGVAFVAGWLALQLVMRRPTLERRLLGYFGLYNITMSVLCAVLLF